MPHVLCPHCLQQLDLPLPGTCPHCGRSLENNNPAGALPFGTLLGGCYTVGDYLSSDGDGLCYQGVENEHQRFVRIKEFFPVTLCNGRSGDGALLPREGREVLFKTSLMDFKDLYEDLLGICPTEGLSQILDVWEENNTVYAVEESVKGMTLTHYLSLRPRPMAPNEACELLSPVMHGVMAMHKAGLVHRGICPDNILLPVEGPACLTGYGTLALRTQGSELKSQLYAGYAAPEQYSAAEFAGTYTDVYALAAVVYRMVTGQKPPHALQRTQHDTLESAHSLESAVPVYFAQVLTCALRLDTLKRMQTVPELERALADPGVAGEMFDRGDNQVSTKKILAISLAAVFVTVALLLWALLGAEPEADAGSDTTAALPVTDTAEDDAELIPNLVGKNYREDVENSDLYAGYRIIVAEENSKTVPQGVIIRQTPMPGTVKKDDQVLELTVSLGIGLVEMPEVVGLDREEVEELLDEAGIPYRFVEHDIYTDAPFVGSFIGEVVTTSVTAGSEIDPTKVTVEMAVAGQLAP